MKPQKSLPASRRGSATIVAVIIAALVIGGVGLYAHFRFSLGGAVQI